MQNTRSLSRSTLCYLAFYVTINVRVYRSCSTASWDSKTIMGEAASSPMIWVSIIVAIMSNAMRRSWENLAKYNRDVDTFKTGH